MIGYGRQWIDEADLKSVMQVLQSDFLTQGPSTEAFEQALADYVGVKHAVAVANGTAALHLACLVADLGPGDTAITPTLTFVATANAPRYCDAKTLLVDICPDGLGMDLKALSQLINDNPKTKAILPVHFAGYAQNASQIREIAAGRIIIEDASHSLGGNYDDGSKIGSCTYSCMTTFSFHPVKTMTTGEGGAITTNNDEFARRLRLLRSHGIERETARFSDPSTDQQSRPWQYEQQALGYNYRMSDIHAALGLSQLRRIDDFIARRREIAAYYDSRFRDIPNIEVYLSSADQRQRSGLHLYLVAIDFDEVGLSRGMFMNQLREAGIGTQVHYIPVHHHPYHAVDAIGEFPNADAYYETTLTLPLHPSLSSSDMAHVVDNVISLLS